MIKSNNVATLYDKNGKHNIECEINKNKELQNYVEFRVKDENGTWIKSYIKIGELYGLIFLLVGEKEQEALMPIKQTEVRTYERQHRIQLKKDMKKGEIVIANCRINVPVSIEEGLSNLIGKRKTSKGILVPR